MRADETGMRCNMEIVRIDLPEKAQALEDILGASPQRDILTSPD